MESGLVSTGPTLATRLGRFGALELTGGASYAGSRGGVAGGIAYEYTGRPGSVSLAWREASEGYENLTSRRMQLGMRREVMASTTARLTSAPDAQRRLAGAGRRCRPSLRPTRQRVVVDLDQPAAVAVRLGDAEPARRPVVQRRALRR